MRRRAPRIVWDVSLESRQLMDGALEGVLQKLGYTAEADEPWESWRCMPRSKAEQAGTLPIL
jgi:hypothetical protein